MTMNKKCFSNVRNLKKIAPTTLGDMLRLFPEFTGNNGIRVPDYPTEENLDYEVIRAALMGDKVPEPLDDIMHLATKLGNNRYWWVVEKQAAEDGRTLPSPHHEYGHVDDAIHAEIEEWPRHKGFLEKANARSRVHGRSSYEYFPPIMDVRRHYKKPTPAGIQAACTEIGWHFYQEGLFLKPEHAKLTQLIPYDFANEIWFLIRYPGRMERMTGMSDEVVWQNFRYKPEQYDAVVYNKVYGDLRMNTHRKKEHATYRTVFSHLLLGKGNIFQKDNKVVTLAPFLSNEASFLFGCQDIQGMEWIEPVMIGYEEYGPPIMQHEIKHKERTSLRLGNRNAPRLLPEEAIHVLQIELAYKLVGKEKPASVVLHNGNRIRYERDGDSIVLEEWMRKRNTLKTNVPLDGYAPETGKAITNIAVGE